MNRSPGNGSRDLFAAPSEAVKERIKWREIAGVFPHYDVLYCLRRSFCASMKRVERMTKEKAFSLIELLLVISIIGILATIAVPSLLQAQTRARVSRVKAELNLRAKGFERYHVEFNTYPPYGLSGSAGGYNNYPNSIEVLEPHWLTTPVPYVSRKAYPNIDIFREGTDIDDWRSWYEYWNLKDAASSDPTGFVSHARCSWYGYWRTGSSGPDLNCYDGTNHGVICYDPTNGTTSTGDIVRCQRYSLVSRDCP